jgi:hypothetical protein
MRVKLLLPIQAPIVPFRLHFLIAVQMIIPKPVHFLFFAVHRAKRDLIPELLVVLAGYFSQQSALCEQIADALLP